jgi:hypothetical protein
VPAIEEIPGEELGECPPDALHIGLVIRHVGVVEIDPEPQLLGEALPLLGVTEDALETATDEGLHPVLDDRILPGDAELLLHLDLDGEAVGVPARSAGHVEAAHGLVTGEDVLHHAGQRVAVVGHPVRGRGAFVEDEPGPSPTLREGFREDVALAPELANS